LYGEAGHFAWLLRNTMKNSAKFVMFTLEGKLEIRSAESYKSSASASLERMAHISQTQ
jgi:hypothetical protein